MDCSIKAPVPFNLAVTLDCGQAFRFRDRGDGIFEGIAKGRLLSVKQQGDYLIFYNTTREEYEDIWSDYLDLNRDYGEIDRIISRDPTLKKICESQSGIRVMNQEPFETLISFIISQNNNIPRIKGIIDRLCEGFGSKIDGGFAFPSAEVLAALEPADLAPLRAGFRARYIIDAARKCSSGEVVLKDLVDMPLDDAREELMKITGVGRKVADCTLLFGLRHKEAFPIDVWMKRAMQTLFCGELPEVAKPYAGIVQQYIFNYSRTHKEIFGTE